MSILRGTVRDPATVKHIKQRAKETLIDLAIKSEDSLSIEGKIFSMVLAYQKVKMILDAGQDLEVSLRKFLQEEYETAIGTYERIASKTPLTAQVIEDEIKQSKLEIKDFANLDDLDIEELIALRDHPSRVQVVSDEIFSTALFQKVLEEGGPVSAIKVNNLRRLFNTVLKPLVSYYKGGRSGNILRIRTNINLGETVNPLYLQGMAVVFGLRGTDRENIIINLKAGKPAINFGLLSRYGDSDLFISLPFEKRGRKIKNLILTGNLEG